MAEKKGGLSPQHHGELNGPGIAVERFQELRSLYENDPRALQQIDVYDGSTEYHAKFCLFTEALKLGDTTKWQELQTWFDEHYPDV